jgi:hypothetical protein
MVGLLLLGMVKLIDERRVQWRPLNSTVLLALWIGFTAVATFIINLRIPVFLSPRRILLITPAIVLLTARGLTNFKNPARIFLVGAILVYGLATVDDYYPKAPWNKVADNLALYAHPDQLVLMEIYRDDFTVDYYVDQLLSPSTPRASLRLWREDRASEYPDGLISLIDQHEIVWLVHWSPDQSAFRFLEQTGHVQTAKMSVDHWGNSLDLYRFDRMPSEAVEQYANGMTLRMDRIEADDSRVDLWWSVDQALGADFTTSVFLLDESGQLVAQHDNFPFLGARPTTSWQPGEVVYDPHPLDLSALPPGNYSVNVQVYTWQDQVKQPTSSGDPWLTIGALEKP